MQKTIQRFIHKLIALETGYRFVPGGTLKGFLDDFGIPWSTYFSWREGVNYISPPSIIRIKNAVLRPEKSQAFEEVVSTLVPNGKTITSWLFGTMEDITCNDSSSKEALLQGETAKNIPPAKEKGSTAFKAEWNVKAVSVKRDEIFIRLKKEQCFKEAKK